jgi:hypothetical protein
LEKFSGKLKNLEKTECAFFYEIFVVIWIREHMCGLAKIVHTCMESFDDNTCVTLYLIIPKYLLITLEHSSCL